MARNATVTIILTARNLAGKVLGEIRGGVTRIRTAVFSLQGALATLGASLTTAGVLTFLVRVNRETGKLLTQLQTFEGSSRAARGVFNQLAKFAAETPFQINELVEAYVQLRSRGIHPTMETLRLLGDHAAAMGVRMTDLGVAISAAVSGEFEPMARSLGVKMRVMGNEIAATFDGVTTMIGRDTQSIVNYLEKLSRAKFAGGMERQAKTLDGALSNAQDAAEQFARAVGDAGLTKDLIGATKALTAFIGKASAIDEIAVQYASFRAVLLTIVDAFALVGHAAFAPIEIAAHEISAVVRGVVATVAATLAGAGQLIDRFTGGRTSFGKRIGGFADDMARSAIAQANAGFQAFKSVGEHAGEALARASLRGEEIDALAARAAAGGASPAGGGLKNKGFANAASTVFDPAAEGKAERQRAEVIDNLTEQAALLEEQIKLRVAGNDALEKALSLETRLALLMGKNGTTPKEQLQLLQQAGSLRQARKDAGMVTPEEQLDTTLRGLDTTFDPATMEARALKEARGLKIDMPAQSFGERIGFAMKDAIGETQTLNQIIADMATGTLRNFGSAIETAFAAMAQGSISAGAAFSSAMLGAIGEVASSLGQLALGKAGIALGDALIGGPLGAGGWAAFGKYTAAAAALFAIAGVIKGKAAAIGGSGARSGRGDASRANGRLDGSAGEATLIIEGDPVLDMSVPRTERQFRRALESLGRRKVRVKRARP